MLRWAKNIFTKGISFDRDKRVMPPDRLTDVNDIEIISESAGNTLAARTLHSSQYLHNIPPLSQQPQINRVVYEGNSVTHRFYVYDPVTLDLIASVAASSVSFGAFKTALTAGFAAFGLTVAYDPSGSSLATGTPFTISLTQGGEGTPFRYILTEFYGSSTTEVTAYTVQDAYAFTGQFRELATAVYGDYEFILSSNVGGTCDEIGVAVPDVNGTWTYTRLLRSWQFGLPTNKKIDFSVEKVAQNFYGLYWTDATNKPKVMYVREDFSTDCVLKYLPASYTTAAEKAYYTLESIGEATNLQIINNSGLVVFKEQLPSGGQLAGGGFRYSVRFGINGTEDVTEWSVLTPSVIPVFDENPDASGSYLKIQGKPVGFATTKINVLTVKNANPKIFNFVELAYVYYAGGATSVGRLDTRFDITADEFDITHTGFETVLADIDATALPQYDDVITKASNLEIKKNRLNIADCEIAVTDSDLSEVFGGATIEQDVITMANVGILQNLFTVTQAWTLGSNVNPIILSALPPVRFATAGINSYSTYNPASGVWTVTASDAGYYQIDFNFDLFGQIVGLGAEIAILVNGTAIASKYVNPGNANSATTTTLSANISLAIGDTVYFQFINIPTTTYSSGALVQSTTQFKATRISTASTTGNITGEYQLPLRCANYVGHLVNERYAIFGRIHWKIGYISDPVFIGYKTISPNSNTEIFSDGTSDSNTLIYGLKVTGIDISSIKTLINGISFWRAEVNPRIQGTGLYFPAAFFGGGNFNVGYYSSIPNSDGEYGTAVATNSNLRKFGSFFCMDGTQKEINANSGDKLIILGAPKKINNSNGIASSPNFRGAYAEYSGYVPGGTTKVEYNIEDASPLGFASDDGVLLRNTTAGLAYKYANAIGADSTQNRGLGITTTNFVLSGASAGNDNGAYLAQVKANISDDAQYNIQNVKISPTGYFFKAEPGIADVIDTEVFYGGDVYVQKNVLKLQYRKNDSIAGTLVVRTSFITYYSQNRNNFQLFWNNETLAPESWNLFGFQDVFKYLFAAGTEAAVLEEQFNYDSGYSFPNKINLLTAYNSKFPSYGKFRARIYYSDQKPQNSIQDSYRKIRPGNYKDLENKNGPITALFDIGDNMVAWQPDAVSRLPYDSDAALGKDDNIYIGNGGVYGQREIQVSIYGTAIKTGVLKAQNRNGNPQAYWYSEKYKRFLRYGANGAEGLSDDNEARSWFNESTNFIVDNFDIVLGYFPELQRVFITARAHNDTVANWSSATTYNTAGQLVFYGTTSKYQTFEQTGDIYSKIGVTVSTNQNPYDNPSVWQFIAHTNMAYYNEWTLFWDEINNTFSSKCTPLPERYFTYKNRLLAPRGIPDYSRMYDLFGGTTYLTWFADGVTEKTGTWVIEFSVSGDEVKLFKSLEMSVDQDHNPANNPTVTITTPVQDSNINPAAMKLNFGKLQGAFRYDDSGKPIIAQYAIIRMSGTAYIKMLSTKTGYRFVKY